MGMGCRGMEWCRFSHEHSSSAAMQVSPECGVQRAPQHQGAGRELRAAPQLNTNMEMHY